MNRFQEVLPLTLQKEGGWSDHKADPGGATMQGVTLETFRRFYGRDRTKEDLRNISRKQLEHIYQTGYWYPSCADKMWKGLDRVAFDAAVNSGPKRGIQWVQKAVGARADGSWGPETSKAINQPQDYVKTVQRACAARMGFLRGLSHWSTFGRGWSRRVAEVEAKATQEAGMSPSRRRVETEKARQVAKGQSGAATGSGGSPFALWGMDVPLEVVVPIAVLMVFAAVILIRRASHNKDRAAAYEALNAD